PIPGITVPGIGTNKLIISGTPTATGTETFTLTMTDTIGVSIQQSYSLTVNPVVTLSPTTVPAGDVGTAYDTTINAVGGTGSKAISVTNIFGSVPGINLPNSGTDTLDITGVPTSNGTLN